jgi:Family of unknown function (DUF6525)
MARRGPPRAAPQPTTYENDRSPRHTMWRRFTGDDWAAFDALPAVVRQRLCEHAYDAWTVNALILWRAFRRKRDSAQRAQRALLRYLDICEQLEREAFAAAYQRAYGSMLPHVAAGATVLRSIA